MSPNSLPFDIETTCKQTTLLNHGERIFNVFLDAVDHLPSRQVTLPDLAAPYCTSRVTSTSA